MSWTRVARDGLSLVGLIVLGWFATTTFTLGSDAHVYWSVDLRAPYAMGPNAASDIVFRYSPVAAQAFALIGAVPWPLFLAAWLGLLIVALAWLCRGWTLAALAVPVITYSLWLGNIEILLAAAIVAGFRWPAAWAFVLLTKVSPGVGLLWFAVRREWRSLAIALGITAAIAAVSFALAPGLWAGWIRSLSVTDDALFQQVPLVWRLAGAALLVTWGARTDRRWTVIVAAALAAPWFSTRSLAVLVGLVPLRLRATSAP